jgi:hypothetical protein
VSRPNVSEVEQDGVEEEEDARYPYPIKVPTQEHLEKYLPMRLAWLKFLLLFACVFTIAMGGSQSRTVFMVILIAVLTYSLRDEAPECKNNPVLWAKIFWRRNVRGYYLLAHSEKEEVVYHVVRKEDFQWDTQDLFPVGVYLSGTLPNCTLPAICIPIAHSPKHAWYVTGGGVWDLDIRKFDLSSGLHFLQLKGEGGDRLTFHLRSMLRMLPNYVRRSSTCNWSSRYWDLVNENADLKKEVIAQKRLVAAFTSVVSGTIEYLTATKRFSRSREAGQIQRWLCEARDRLLAGSTLSSLAPPTFMQKEDTTQTPPPED